MKVYKVTSHCRCSRHGNRCYNFSVDVNEWDSPEEAKEDYPDYDPEDTRALEYYDIEEFYLLGTKKQIEYSYNSANFYELEGDPDEIREHEEEFTQTIEDLDEE